MTFDELWRKDLDRVASATGSRAKAEETDAFTVSKSSDFALDQLDEDELDRYLQWLEKSLA
jgi:hypothetical protein